MGVMRYAEHVADLIGHTPLVRLNHVVPTGPDAPLVLAKVEYFNPGGSVKDRIAEKMIDAAEASGELKPGGTIVEPTSGNTGIGLAIIAQQRGYHCIFVVPDKVSVAKQDALRAYGAEVVVCPAAVEPESPESYYSVSDRLARDTLKDKLLRHGHFKITLVAEDGKDFLKDEELLKYVPDVQ